MDRDRAAEEWRKKTYGDEMRPGALACEEDFKAGWDAQAARIRELEEALKKCKEAIGIALSAENWENDINGDERAPEPNIKWPDHLPHLSEALSRAVDVLYPELAGESTPEGEKGLEGVMDAKNIKYVELKADTLMKHGNCGDKFFLAFKSGDEWVALVPDGQHIAAAVAGYFRQMAKAYQKEQESPCSK